MNNKKNLFKKLDGILNEIFEYSFILGNIGKYVWIEMYIRDNGHNGRGSVLKPSKEQVFKNSRICNGCFEDIYVSKYNYIDDSYNIYFNTSIREVRKNGREIKELISDIETLAFDVYNIIVNSYLDPSRIYPKLSIYFRRDISNSLKIYKEIRNSIIIGHTTLEEIGFNGQPAYRSMALKENKTGDLFYPKNYRFSFMVYR